MLVKLFLIANKRVVLLKALIKLFMFIGCGHEIKGHFIWLFPNVSVHCFKQSKHILWSLLQIEKQEVLLQLSVEETNKTGGFVYAELSASHTVSLPKIAIKDSFK